MSQQDSTPVESREVVDKVVLHSYLKKLYLSTFLRHHEAYAAEATESNQSYSRFLLALAEQEVLEREAKRRQRRLKEAKIPVVKDLISFDFDMIPQLNQQKIRQLLTGEYMEKAEPVILIGNPGLGKTHIATALAVAATQAQGTTTVRGAEELRRKESDRIESIVSNLRRMGATVTEHRDGFDIEGPARLEAAQIDSFGDHRIAMAFAIAGLIADGTTQISGAQAADVSYPGFWDDLDRVALR